MVSANLLLQAEKILPQPVHPNLIACCPTMDLVAVVNQEEQLNVYRFGGQRAFGLQRRNAESTVKSLGWKFNGQYLAVGWSDGIVEVVSAETGNVLQHFRQASLSSGRSKKNVEAAGGVSCIGWGLNFIDVASVKKKTGARSRLADNQTPFDGLTTDNWKDDRDLASVDDFLERVPDPGKIEIPLDLPDHLAQIDIASSMVKLPALPLLPPAAYKSGDHPAAELFASQVSLDAALSSNSSHSCNGLEALLLAQDSGTVRLILYDSLGIGNVSMPTEWKLSGTKFRRCAFHPYSSTYVFLVDLPTHNGLSRTALLPLSLRFLQSSGSQLHIIESKTAQLEILVQYIGECLLAIQHHWKHSKELPSRFMEGINETLTEKEEPNLMQSLFHLAATGDCPPTLKEWLVDILAERGHKRWDHAVTHGYTKVLELAHENLLPALDRCVAILSHLRGLAIYYEHSPVFNVSANTFDVILNTIRCMRLLAHHVLLFSSEELQQFNVFSKWLRREIDVQAADPAASSSDDAEQDVNVDYSLLLAYIQGPLVQSRLNPFVKLEQEAPEVPVEPDMYEVVKKALDSFKKGEDPKAGIVSLGAYFGVWMKYNQMLVDRITSHQRASSSINCGLVIDEGDVLVEDVRMVFEQEDDQNEDCVTTFTAIVRKKTPYQVNFLRLVHGSEFESLKAVRASTGGTLQLPNDTEIRDMKVVDDEAIMLLVANKDTSSLLTFTYRGHNTQINIASPLKSDIYSSQLPRGKPVVFSSDTPTIVTTEGLAEYVRHTFSADDRLKPLKIEVNGRQNRRFVVVLGEDLRQMRILDLDFEEGDVEAGGRSGDEGMSE